MKKLLLVCLLCLIPYLSFASGPAVLATGTCTRDNMRLSTIAGTAFWQCNGVDISAFAGEYIELRDTANKVLRGFAKAAGGGLAYGSDKDVDGITKANPGVVTLAASSAITDGMCVYFSGLTEMTDLNTKYRTVKGTSGDTFQLESTSGYAAAETTGGNCLKQLTVPAATGVTIVSTNGGTTYNWAFTESGFNVNDSSYTYRILSTNIPGKQIASGTVSATDVKLATVDGGSMVDITGLNFSDITDEGWIKKLVPTLWLRAEDLTATLGDGDAVGTWTDKMGSYNATQSTADNKPTLQTNEINGKAVVRFDGSNDYLTLGDVFDSFIAIPNAKFTIFAVAYSSSTNTQYIISKIGDSTHSEDQREWGLSLINDTVMKFRFMSYYALHVAPSAYRIEGANFTGSAWNCLSAIYDSSNSNANRFNLYKNGQAMPHTYTLSAGADGSIQNGTARVAIGAAIGTSSSVVTGPFNGDIAEIIVFNRALSDAERNQVEKSLSVYYGFTLASSNPVPSTFVGDDAGGPVTIINPKSTSAATMTTNKYLLALYDSSGRVATGYVGAAGGGETLGAEIATGTLTAGKLYKITATEANHFYTGCAIGEYFTSVGTETCDASNKVQEVTEVEATGLHGHSTANGTDRKMSLKTTGFDPNAVTKYKIYRTY